MTIQLTDAGKRFNRDWIFRHVTYNFYGGKSYAITGPNGSGKSTLLQAIAGSMNMSEGICESLIADRKLEDGEIYKYISIVAPYLEVIEEMSAKEFLLFHASFKPLLSSVTIDEVIKIIGLDKISLADNEKDFAQRLNKIASVSQQEAIIEELDKASYYIERNANGKMLFQALSIKLFHIIQNKVVLAV